MLLPVFDSVSDMIDKADTLRELIIPPFSLWMKLTHPAFFSFRDLTSRLLRLRLPGVDGVTGKLGVVGLAGIPGVVGLVEKLGLVGLAGIDLCLRLVMLQLTASVSM